jgi:hypothetical protein
MLFGLAGTLQPVAIFSSGSPLILFQAIQHHVVLSLVGFYMLVSGRVAVSIKAWAISCKTFGIIFFFCMILNSVFQDLFLEVFKSGEPFNAFYSGPFSEWQLPMVSDWFTISPFSVWMVFYLFVNALGGFIILGIAVGIKTAVSLIKKRVAKLS